MADGETDTVAELAAMRGTLDNGFKSLEVSLAQVARITEENRRSLEQVDDRVAVLEQRRANLRKVD